MQIHLGRNSVAKSVMAAAVAAWATIASVGASPLVPTIRLMDDDLATFVFDLAMQAGAMEYGSETVAVMELADGSKFDVRFSICAPSEGDAPLPTLVMGEGSAAHLALALTPLTAGVGGPKIAREICAMDGEDMGGSFGAPSGDGPRGDPCAAINRSVHIICGDGALSWFSGVVSVDVVPSAPGVTRKSDGTTNGADASTGEVSSDSLQFGSMQVTPNGASMQSSGDGVTNSPLVRTIRRVEGQSEPELSPLVPTIWFRGGNGRVMQATIWARAD